VISCRSRDIGVDCLSILSIIIRMTDGVMVMVEMITAYPVCVDEIC
jgi:hypothetical protein